MCGTIKLNISKIVKLSLLFCALSIGLIIVVSYFSLNVSFNRLDYPSSVRNEYIGYTSTLFASRVLRELGFPALSELARNKSQSFFYSAKQKNKRHLDNLLWEIWPYYYEFDQEKEAEFISLISFTCKEFPRNSDRKEQETLHTVMRASKTYLHIIRTYPHSFASRTNSRKLARSIRECASQSHYDYFTMKLSKFASELEK